MYQRIVVPLDGSDVAVAALPDAIRLARTYNAPIALVRVVDPPFVERLGAVEAGTAYARADVAYRNEHKAAEEYLDRQIQRLKQEGIEASALILWGQAAASVASVVNDTDLLVLSSHGKTGIRRWFMGSVAEDILKRTDIPVLIVRKPSSEEST